MRPDEDEPPLIDYFVSVSVVSDKAAIIDRYPCDDKSSLPLPASIPLFCIPDIREVNKPPYTLKDRAPKTFCFVMTSGDGANLYGCCLGFYEPVASGATREITVLQDETLQVVRKVLCIVSRWQFISFFESLLRALHEQYVISQRNLADLCSGLSQSIYRSLLSEPARPETPPSRSVPDCSPFEHNYGEESGTVPSAFEDKVGKQRASCSAIIVSHLQPLQSYLRHLIDYVDPPEPGTCLLLTSPAIALGLDAISRKHVNGDDACPIPSVSAVGEGSVISSVCGGSSIDDHFEANATDKSTKNGLLGADTTTCVSEFLNCDRPHEWDLPYVDPQCIFTLFECLDPANVLEILCCLLLDQRIILHSADTSRLAPVALALRALLFPFPWLHVFVPVLPPPLLGFVQMPVPGLLGLSTSALRIIEEKLQSVSDGVEKNAVVNDGLQESKGPIDILAPTEDSAPGRLRYSFRRESVADWFTAMQLDSSEYHEEAAAREEAFCSTVAAAVLSGENSEETSELLDFSLAVNCLREAVIVDLDKNCINIVPLKLVELDRIISFFPLDRPSAAVQLPNGEHSPNLPMFPLKPVHRALLLLRAVIPIWPAVPKRDNFRSDEAQHKGLDHYENAGGTSEDQAFLKSVVTASNLDFLGRSPSLADFKLSRMWSTGNISIRSRDADLHGKLSSFGPTAGSMAHSDKQRTVHWKSSGENDISQLGRSKSVVITGDAINRETDTPNNQIERVSSSDAEFSSRPCLVQCTKCGCLLAIDDLTDHLFGSAKYPQGKLCRAAPGGSDSTGSMIWLDHSKYRQELLLSIDIETSGSVNHVVLAHGSIGLDMDFSPASVIFSAALAYSTPSKHTGVVVCGFRAKSDGSKSIAETSGHFSLGCRILAVNGQPVDSKAEISLLLKLIPGPITLSVWTPCAKNRFSLFRSFREVPSMHMTPTNFSGTSLSLPSDNISGSSHNLPAQTSRGFSFEDGSSSRKKSKAVLYPSCANPPFSAHVRSALGLGSQWIRIARFVVIDLFSDLLSGLPTGLVSQMGEELLLEENRRCAEGSIERRRQERLNRDLSRNKPSSLCPESIQRRSLGLSRCVSIGRFDPEAFILASPEPYRTFLESLVAVAAFTHFLHALEQAASELVRIHRGLFSASSGNAAQGVATTVLNPVKDMRHSLLFRVTPELTKQFNSLNLDRFSDSDSSCSSASSASSLTRSSRAISVEASDCFDLDRTSGTSEVASGVDCTGNSPGGFISVFENGADYFQAKPTVACESRPVTVDSAPESAPEGFQDGIESCRIQMIGLDELTIIASELQTDCAGHLKGLFHPPLSANFGVFLACFRLKAMSSVKALPLSTVNDDLNRSSWVIPGATSSIRPSFLSFLSRLDTQPHDEEQPLDSMCSKWVQQDPVLDFLSLSCSALSFPVASKHCRCSFVQGQVPKLTKPRSFGEECALSYSCAVKGFLYHQVLLASMLPFPIVG